MLKVILAFPWLLLQSKNRIQEGDWTTQLKTVCLVNAFRGIRIGDNGECRTSLGEGSTDTHRNIVQMIVVRSHNSIRVCKSSSESNQHPTLKTALPPGLTLSLTPKLLPKKGPRGKTGAAPRCTLDLFVSS